MSKFVNSANEKKAKKIENRFERWTQREVGAYILDLAYNKLLSQIKKKNCEHRVLYKTLKFFLHTGHICDRTIRKYGAIVKKYIRPNDLLHVYASELLELALRRKALIEGGKDLPQFRYPNKRMHLAKQIDSTGYEEILYSESFNTKNKTTILYTRTKTEKKNIIWSLFNKTMYSQYLKKRFGKNIFVVCVKDKNIPNLIANILNRIIKFTP